MRTDKKSMQRLFLLLQLLINALRTILFPLVRWPLAVLSRQVGDRVAFELSNQDELCCESWSCQQKSAFAAFEVSSEGELEQIRPLLDHYIKVGKRVELIISSPSVEKKCHQLFQENPNFLRFLRLPLLTYLPWRGCGGQQLQEWVTADILFLCRYDFYPELLLLGARPEKLFILLSATLKGKKFERGQLGHYYYSSLYALFDFVVTASVDDIERFKYLGFSDLQLSTFDFRVIQITSRIKDRDKVLQKHPFYPFLQNHLGQFLPQDRLILGSAYSSEMQIFADKEWLEKIAQGQFHVTIAPHKLNPQSIDDMARQFREITQQQAVEIPIYLLKPQMQESAVELLFADLERCPGVLIISIPAILVELYSSYGLAYVGGGYGHSIHSVLEPFLSANRIFCGPKIDRSREYDFVKLYSPDMLQVVPELNDFAQLIKNLSPAKNQLGQAHSLEYYQSQLLKIVGTISQLKESRDDIYGR